MSSISEAPLSATPARGASKRARRTLIYMSPYANATNMYLTNMRRNLEAAGFSVVSADELWKHKAWFRRDSEQYVLLNWFEDRVLRKRAGSRLIAWLVFAYKLASARIQPVSIIWVRHNYRTHDQDVPNWIATAVQSMLERSSQAIVVHSQAVAAREGYCYLPHPLYDDVQGDNVQVDSTRNHSSKQYDNGRLDVPDLDQRVAVLGQLRRSKGIEAMLEKVSPELSLVIAGKPGSREYEQEIRSVIQQRGLDVVVLPDKLSDSQFNWLMRGARAIYVANPDQTMIVSGVFFHAASVGTPVILNSSAFAREMSEKCSFAIYVNDASEILDALESHAFPARDEIIAESRDLFGTNAFLEAVTQLMQSLDSPRPAVHRKPRQ